MITIRSSEYEGITRELIEYDIASYRSRFEIWKNTENIAKPYPNYLVVATIVENDEEWEFVDDVSLDSDRPSHNDMINVAHSDYNYLYARRNAIDGYGTLEKQLEYIAENGITAFKSKQIAVKERYPKP